VQNSSDLVGAKVSFEEIGEWEAGLVFVLGCFFFLSSVFFRKMDNRSLLNKKKHPKSQPSQHTLPTTTTTTKRLANQNNTTEKGPKAQQQQQKKKKKKKKPNPHPPKHQKKKPTPTTISRPATFSTFFLFFSYINTYIYIYIYPYPLCSAPPSPGGTLSSATLPNAPNSCRTCSPVARGSSDPTNSFVEDCAPGGVAGRGGLRAGRKWYQNTRATTRSRMVVVSARGCQYQARADRLKKKKKKKKKLHADENEKWKMKKKGRHTVRFDRREKIPIRPIMGVGKRRLGVENGPGFELLVKNERHTRK
jgi:hypothetical protein